MSSKHDERLVPFGGGRDTEKQMHSLCIWGWTGLAGGLGGEGGRGRKPQWKQREVRIPESCLGHSKCEVSLRHWKPVEGVWNGAWISEVRPGFGVKRRLVCIRYTEAPVSFCDVHTGARDTLVLLPL